VKAISPYRSITDIINTGGIIFPIIFHQLQPRVGFGWTTRIIGFIVLLAAIIPVIGLRMRTQPSAVRKVFDVRAWRELPFIASSVFFFLVFMGAYIPPFYIQSYASDTNVVGETLAPYLLPLLNVGSFFGRIVCSRLF
jgi:phosphoglycerol transferase MdoB-like AlkP superfamily enzyme